MTRLRELPVRERTAAVFVAVVCGFLVTGGVLSLTLAKPSFSDVERRPLAPVPALSGRAYLSGRLTRGLSIHYADTFPFRETFLKYHHRFDELKGHHYEDMKLYFATPGAGPGDQEDQEDPGSDGLWAGLDLGLIAGRIAPGVRPGRAGVARTGEPASALKTPSAVGPAAAGPATPGRDAASPRPRPEPPPDHRPVEKVGNLVVLGDAAFYLYGGAASVANHYVAVVNEAARILSGRARVYCLPVPTAVEFHLPSKYGRLNRSQREIMRHVFAGLRQVTAVDVYEDLAAHQDEYLYFRTDHHWTALGAYYAYAGFARTLGYAASPRSAYRELDFGKFWGTLYGATRNSSLAANPDRVTAWAPPGKYTVTEYDSAGRSQGDGDIIDEKAHKKSDKYQVFLHGDLPYLRIVNDGKPRRPMKLLVIKESFGNIFVPWLAPDYREIHVADVRTFPYGLASFVEKHAIDEVLFINNLFAVCDKSRIRELQRIVQRP